MNRRGIRLIGTWWRLRSLGNPGHALPLTNQNDTQSDWADLLRAPHAGPLRLQVSHRR